MTTASSLVLPLLQALAHSAGQETLVPEEGDDMTSKATHTRELNAEERAARARERDLKPDEAMNKEMRELGFGSQPVKQAPPIPKDAHTTPGPWDVGVRQSSYRDAEGLFPAFEALSVSGRNDFSQCCIVPLDESSDANAHLIAAAPIGYELADAVLAEAQDGIDRSVYILERAREFIRKARGAL